jgi:exopolysaccharide production protein ExoZ
MAGPKVRQHFPLIQALRAVAALSVVIYHACHDALILSPGNRFISAVTNTMPWPAGVDIFFVISGFVIAHSSARLFARPGAHRIFLARRCARIVPLYWLVTTLFLLSLALLPGDINGSLGGFGFILKSYAFIPSERPDGLLQPAFGLGWTLNFEVFFYAVFTPFLALSATRAITAATACLTVFVIAGAVVPFTSTVLVFWSNPIVLEFCAGMLLALLANRLTLSLGVRMVLAILAVAALHLYQHEGPERFFAWGIPAVCLVLAAITGRQTGSLPRLERWLALLGDASYALYLTHPFVIRATTLLWRHRHLGSVAYVLTCLALAQALAVAVHRIMERPATRWVRAHLEPGETGLAAV